MNKPNPNPLSSMDDWEEDLLKRYPDPDPEMTKEKKDYRNYNDSDREDTV